MDLGLTNKSVLVSGSSAGIGFAIAEALLQEGARVQISGRNVESLKDALQTLSERYSPENIDIFCGDLTKQDTINKKQKTEIMFFTVYVHLLGNCM